MGWCRRPAVATIALGFTIGLGPLGTTAASAAGLPSMTLGSASIVEGNAGRPRVQVPMTLDRPASAAVTVRYRIVGGTAQAGPLGSAGIDVGNNGGKTVTVKFPLGTNGTPVTALAHATIVADATPEPDEEFSIEIVDVTGATAATTSAPVRIIDDDASPGLTVAVGDVAVGEGDATNRSVRVGVTLSEPRSTPTAFDYQIVPFTASGDFRPYEFGTGVIPIGTDTADWHGTVRHGSIPARTVSGSVTVPLYPDTQPETDEAFVIVLSNPSSGVGLGRTVGIGTIRDDDDGTATTLNSWGNDLFQGLGSTEALPLRAPHTVGTTQYWRTMAAGWFTAAGIASDGTLWTWGNDVRPQTPSSPTPTQIGVDTDWVDVSVGNAFVIVRKADGSLWGLGNNIRGQLGDGTTTHTATFVPIASGTTWMAQAAGETSALGIRADGTLWRWGTDVALNNGTYSSTPVQVGTAANWVQVGLGTRHAVALNAASEVWSWGFNGLGELGDGTLISRSAPVLVGSGWSAIRVGPETTFAMRPDGELDGWGRNSSAELAAGIPDLGVSSPTVAAGGRRVVDVAIGVDHVVAIDTDGRLLAWGATSSSSEPEKLGTIHGGTPPTQPGLVGFVGTTGSVAATWHTSYSLRR